MKTEKIWMLLLLILCLPCVTFAHTLWLNASDYSPTVYPRFGAETKLYFGWGHHYPVDDFLTKDSLKEYFLVDSEGKKKELDPNPGGFLATKVSFKKQGTYIACAALRPGFYTLYEKDGKMHHKRGPKTGVQGVVLSLFFEEYAKALIQIGQEIDDTYKIPVGQNLEILLLRHPFQLKPGEFLPIQVLLKNKPARYCRIYGTYSGFSSDCDFAYATKTNGKGEAKIRILHHGSWLIKAEMRIPAPKDLLTKCNELSYSTTLTFEVP